jgi:hypothetical protein
MNTLKQCYKPLPIAILCRKQRSVPVINYLDHKGQLQTWAATSYIRQAWDIFIKENEIVGVADYSQFCLFLLVMIAVANESRSESKK